jgi:hypothetical protein
MSTMLVLVSLTTVWVWFLARAKNLGLSSSMRAWEDDEQVRLIRTATGRGEPSVAATLH